MASTDLDRVLADLSQAAADYDADRVEELSKALVDSLTSHTQNDPAHSTRALALLVQANDADRIHSISQSLATNLRGDPTPRPVAFVTQLTRAVNEFDRARVRKLCKRLRSRLRANPTLYDEAHATKILAALRKKRYFKEMIELGDLFLQIELDTAPIRRLYAQALLDSGHVAIAQVLLEKLKRDCKRSGNIKEYHEACGLIGRAYKQIYLDGATGSNPGNRKFRSRILKRAIKAYADIYHEDESMHWHGVNAVALVARARRDRIRLSKAVSFDYRREAKKIVRRLEEQLANEGGWCTSRDDAPVSMWDCASAAEACLAGGNTNEAAVEWTAKYVSAKYAGNADAFKYASTLRQFEDLWQLDSGDADGGRILELLRSALIRTEGGRIDVAAADNQHAIAKALCDDKDRFEAVLGVERYKTLRWYMMGLERAMAVARVVDRTGRTIGTGFLLEADEIDASIQDDWVFVTNAHVVSNDPLEQDSSQSPPSHSPSDVEIKFDTGPNKEMRYRGGSILFTSGRLELDCTIMTLVGDVALDPPIHVARALPAVDKERRVYVIGHPKGNSLAFSIDDNLLLDHDTTRLHYRAPTDQGSSGSPVFNRDWSLIAVHHYGGLSMSRLNNKPGTYAANEGIAIKKILKAARDVLVG